MDTVSHIGACAVLFNERGEVLMGKRKNSYKAGLYGLPGGRVEVNEPLNTAIKREVLEETGLAFEDTEFEYAGVVRENQGAYDFIHFVYVVHHVRREPMLCEPDKCEGWEWVQSGRYEEQMLPGHLAALRLVSTSLQLVDICTE